MKRHGLLITAFAALALTGQAGDTEIIIESYSDGLNAQGFSQPAGKWSESTGKSTAEGLHASKALYNDADSDPATARFTPEIPVAGKYEVFITYPVQGNATDIKYNVVSADGPKEAIITQNGRDLGHNPVANSWHSLGVFSFAQGNAGYVEVSDPLTGERPLASEPNARIYADAVKFVPVDVKLPDDYVNAKGTGTAAPAAPVAEATTPAAPSAPVASAAELPNLPSAPAAPAAPSADGLPSLPTAPAASVADASGLPSLPSAPADAASGLPSLPSAPADAAPGLPSLPSAPAPADSAVSGLPALPTQAAPTPPSLTTPPADSAATALPSLPAATPAIGLPNLPALAATPAPAVSQPLPGAPGTLPSATPGAIGQPLAPAPAQSASGIQWTYDFGSALNAARASNKKVLVFFSAEGNDAVGSYESRFFTHPAVRTAFSNFVLVKVDFPRNTRFAYTLGVFGAGTVVVTDASGDVTARITQLPASEADFVKEISAEKLKPIHTPATTTSAADASTTDAAAQTTETEDAPAADPAVAPADAAPAPGAEAEAAPPADNMM